MCPNSNADTFILDQTNDANNLIENPNSRESSEFVYLTPIANFLHVDFLFRTIDDSYKGLDVCTLKISNINSQAFIYREIVFRFYRVC